MSACTKLERSFEAPEAFNSRSSITALLPNTSSKPNFSKSLYINAPFLLILSEKGRVHNLFTHAFVVMRTGIFEDEQFYVCHDGRELRHLRTESKELDGYTQTFEVYGCADCSGCEHKARCLYKYDAEKDAEKNKVMKINEQWEELKERSHANIQSERGILKRQIRSLQTEGHFGDIKENENFRRFNYRSSDKVYKEFMLYAIGRNINKYHRFLYEKLRKFEGKTA